MISTPGGGMVRQHAQKQNKFYAQRAPTDHSLYERVKPIQVSANWSLIDRTSTSVYD